jgi:hypothetical protein
MTLTATLNDFLSQWSARRAAGERADSVLTRAARRFAAQISPGAPLESAEAAREDTLPLTRATLTVVSGVQAGAYIDLTAREYLIGSGDDCDIVLLDPAIAPRHVTVTRAWNGFTVRNLRVGKTPPIAPQSVLHESGVIECLYDIGGVIIRLTQHPPAEAEKKPEREVTPRQARAVLWTTAAALLAVLTISLVAVNRAAEPPPGVSQRIVAGSQALLAQGFGMARFRQGTHGALELAGTVASAEEKNRLRKWLAGSDYADAVVIVQSVTDVIEQVRQTLGVPGLQVALNGNRLRVDGTTGQMTVKSRLRALSTELENIIPIEDHVAYVDNREPASPGALPVKLRGVMIGNPSYFLTDTGARYFVGGVLPDGAEVMAIEPTQIRFRAGDRQYVYNLD